MTIDLSHLRMIDYTWIDEYKERLGEDIFREFQNIVYGWLMDMEIGDFIDIISNKRITDKNRDLFIKTVCLFISDGNIGYSFTDDFTKVNRK